MEEHLFGAPCGVSDSCKKAMAQEERESWQVLLFSVVPTKIGFRLYPSFHMLGTGLVKCIFCRVFIFKWGKNRQNLYQLLFS